MKNPKPHDIYHSLIRLKHAEEAEKDRQRELLQYQLGDYTLTQLHILSHIAEHELVNNRVLTDQLNLTRAAISKAVNLLIQEEMITTYQLPDNQKNIFYQLTASGEKLSKAHAVLHRHAETQYRDFLAKFDEETLTKAQYFIDELTLFLDQKEHQHD